MIQELECSVSPETAGSGGIGGVRSVSPSATWELRISEQVASKLRSGSEIIRATMGPGGPTGSEGLGGRRSGAWDMGTRRAHTPLSQHRDRYSCPRLTDEKMGPRGRTGTHRQLSLPLLP